MASFNLSNLADRLSQVITQNTTLASVFPKNDRAIRELFSNLSNGETLLAKVLSVSDGSFQISTENNIIINAKSENGVELTPGSTVLLEVNKFSDSKISLRPLYLNTSYEETAKTALSQAGISENPRALELVARSMEYGNPIDRNSLLIAYKDVLEFPDAPVKYLVDLKQMGLEVNSYNIEGFENYMNMKHLITDSFDDISKSLVSDLRSSFISNDINVANDSILSNGLSLKNFEGALKSIDGMINFVDSLSANENALVYSADEIKVLFERLSESEIEPGRMELLLQNESNVPTKDVLKAYLNDIRTTILKPFEEIEDDTTSKTPDFENLFKDDSLKNLFSKTLISSWTINDKDIGKQEIKELINRLYKDSHNLLDTINNSMPKNSTTSGMIDNLNRNLDFMEQINHYIPYVQIPFNSTNGSHTGELYVYRNRKKLTENDSELTAFLHLDMENLGPTDIYVSLKYNNVSTNFKLANEEALSLINDNISFLDKRLQDKGYSLKCEMSVNDKSKPSLHQMLFESENHLILSKNSFDARV